ncbi:MAG: SDR family oxidoreductase [Acidimicrobiaceae bacterium]|nr:SDR family oxidoreductase [Acidimicrobiaceae bacterium]MYC42461.1 SDR family oxidoreductase [Acidimicrobiaceae bacterium]
MQGVVHEPGLVEGGLVNGVAAWSEPRTAIVTGGGRGIGFAISRRLCLEGAAVAIFERDGDSARSAAEEIRSEGGRVVAYEVDVADRQAVDAAVAATREELGPATILVNNAGISPFKKFRELSREDLEQVFAVNVYGMFDCCQAVLADMVEAGWGRIVNIASSSAQTGSVLQTHYSASKGAVIAFTRSLARELGSKGITVNAVPPSFIDTPGLQQAEQDGFLGSGVEVLLQSMPVKRVGEPEDIAAAVAYLCRDDASFVTGQVLGVNGGRVIG